MSVFAVLVNTTKIKASNKEYLNRFPTFFFNKVHPFHNFDFFMPLPTLLNALALSLKNIFLLFPFVRNTSLLARIFCYSMSVIVIFDIKKVSPAFKSKIIESIFIMKVNKQKDMKGSNRLFAIILTKYYTLDELDEMIKNVSRIYKTKKKISIIKCGYL